MRLLSRTGPSLADHLAEHGPLRLGSPRTVLDAVTDSGLLGRGGAGFPTGRKMRTVAAGPDAMLLGNACDGEPASSKDAILLSHHPHLVLDGLQAAAHAIEASEIHLAIHSGSGLRAAVERALSERALSEWALRVVVHEVPPRYVASEESALINFINTGSAKPTFVPPRPFEQGIGRRPTLVNNAETLAHTALIARHGAAWFRERGDRDEPGTQLLTVLGPGTRQVMEVETGTAVSDVLADVGLVDLRAVLVGGYFGTWLTMEQVQDLSLTHRDMRAVGGALGAGIIVGLPSACCGVLETARVARYLADQNAGQCGPCFNGLPAIAHGLEQLAYGRGTHRDVADLDRWLGVVPGRGACRHPDGAARFVSSALSTFARDVAAHRSGRPCQGIVSQPFLPLPRSAA